MSKVQVTSRHGEPHHRVINHAARGDNRAPVTPEELAMEEKAGKLSSAELRDLADQQLKQANWNANYQSEYLPMFVVFANRHPELKRFADHNSTEITREFDTPEGLGPMKAAGRVEPNLWDCEMAYERAKAKNKLRIDEDVILRQRVAAIEAQVTRHDERDPETMSMSELRALANGFYDPLGPQ